MKSQHGPHYAIGQTQEKATDALEFTQIGEDISTVQSTGKEARKWLAFHPANDPDQTSRVLATDDYSEGVEGKLERIGWRTLDRSSRRILRKPFTPHGPSGGPGAA